MRYSPDPYKIEPKPDPCFAETKFVTRRRRLARRVHQNYDAIVGARCRAWNDLMASPERIASITARKWR